MGRHQIVFAEDPNQPDWQQWDLQTQLLMNFNRKFFGVGMLNQKLVPERTRILKEEVSKCGGVANVSDQTHGLIMSLNFQREEDLTAFLLKWS